MKRLKNSKVKLLKKIEKNSTKTNAITNEIELRKNTKSLTSVESIDSTEKLNKLYDKLNKLQNENTTSENEIKSISETIVLKDLKLQKLKVKQNELFK